jgi:hypothetical protein
MNEDLFLFGVFCGTLFLIVSGGFLIICLIF